MKIEIGKPVDIKTLKGVRYIDFQGHNIISKKVAQIFLKSKDRTVIKKCIICKNKKIHLAAKVMKIEFFQCKNCNHVFNRHRYSEKFLKNFWKKKGDIINVHSHPNQQKYRSKHLSEPKVNKIIGFIKKDLKKVKWLDMGCGNGEFLIPAKKKGINVFGFDLNQRDIRLAKKKGINAYQSNFDEFYNLISKKNIKFDVASSTGYFDMIDDPSKEMSNLGKLLKKGSLLMISLPNFDSAVHEIIKNYPSQSVRHLNACQRSSFTSKSLSYLLKNNGFKIIFRWQYGLDFYNIMNYLNLMNKNFEKSKTMEVMTKRYEDFQKIFDQENSSDTHYVIAKKIN